MNSKRFFLEFSYAGSAYHGWQRQPNAVTVQEVMEEQDEHFCDDVFHSYEEYMEFWGAENLDEAQGSVYGKLYKNWSKEDVDFYAKVVEDADERDKNNIKIRIN